MKDFFPARTQRRNKILSSFKSAVMNDDDDAFWIAWQKITSEGIEQKALKAIAGISAGKKIKKSFLSAWQTNSETLRIEVDDDRILNAALWNLLPLYQGPDMKLYRGETFNNRRRRTYGQCWSSDIEVARCFMRNQANMSMQGGVLLETMAPANAIICAPCLISDERNEYEYVVDRQFLLTVKCLERMPINQNLDNHKR